MAPNVAGTINYFSISLKRLSIEFRNKKVDSKINQFQKYVPLSMVQTVEIVAKHN